MMRKPASDISATNPIDAMNARVTEKIEAMNRAEGVAKVEAIAAVVNEWMAQRTRMCEAMMEIAKKTNNHTMRAPVHSDEQVDRN